MNLEEFKEIFISKSLENNIIISEEQINKFYKYMKNLIEWNKNINLTAIKDEKDIIIKHFIDSIIVRKEIDGEKLIDIGSGAGFPGIPLKIMDDGLNVTLIDAVNKKVNFINNSVELLNLKNTNAIHARAEELAHMNEYREQFDTAVSRAVSNMSTLVEYMLPFVKVGGKCICLKGPNSEEEIEKSTNAIKKLGGEIVNISKYEFERNERCLLIIKKNKKIKKIYPRKQGKPLKEPLA